MTLELLLFLICFQNLGFFTARDIYVIRKKIISKQKKCCFHQIEAADGPAFTRKLYSSKSELCFCTDISVMRYRVKEKNIVIVHTSLQVCADQTSQQTE